MRGIRAGAALVLTSVLAVAPAAVAGPADTSLERVAITGFHEAGDSNSLITRSAPALATVAVDGVAITSGGGGVGEPNAAAVKSEYVTQHRGLRAEILISNSGPNGFSAAAAHRLLSSPENIAKVAEKISTYVEDQNWDGVSIDLERLRKSDSLGFIRFLQALREDLAVGRTISVCVSNSITSKEYLDRGYDLIGIAQNTDRIILMAYDQHGPWEKKPGPVGALGWQRKGLNVALSEVPPMQLDLGQAGYGYAWRPHGIHAVSDARARHLVAGDHAKGHFDGNAGEWTAKLSDGSTLWWADARSFQLRLGIARAKHLHGLAVWNLGESDPITQ